MDINSFSFELPKSLIAEYPTDSRSASRLLALRGSTGQLSHYQFTDLIDLLRPNDLLVFNDTKVIPARAYGHKDSGGKLELLIERVVDRDLCLAHIKANRALKAGTEIRLEGDYRAEVLARVDSLYKLKIASATWLEYLDQWGHIPLPPYINRADEATDRERYQTVYAKHPGAVAAPTAGLHFDDAMLAQLQAKGIAHCFVTLHVGAGTFQPIRVDDINDHQMHYERFTVTDSVCEQVAQCKSNGGRVIAVGTTSVRSLEAASATGVMVAQSDETDIFIYPGYEFKTVDALITNFHLPKSTLLLLVSALAGKDNILRAYRAAVEEKYRFFSYGDAMFIDPKDGDC